MMDDFISTEQILAAKARIWRKLEPQLPMRETMEVLQDAQEEVEISRLLRVQAKERLMDQLPDREPQLSFAQRCWAALHQRRFVAVATLSVFFAVLFAPLFSFSPVAEAQIGNVLKVSEGETSVRRGGDWFRVTDQFVVQEGDFIQTGEGAIAHLHFVDDSRMTLAPQSRVQLTQLHVEPSNRARSEIVVDLMEGEAWTQVLNVVSQDSFVALRFAEGEVVARQRASFNVAVRDLVEVQVARNLVHTLVLKDDSATQGTLGQGVLMLVGDSVEARELSEEEKEDGWWTFNLSYGKWYEADLTERALEEAMEQVNILPGHPLYKLKTLQEDVQALVTFSSEAKQDLAVHTAEKRLVEAQVLLAQGKTDKVPKVMEAYQKSLDEAVVLEASEDVVAHLEEAQKVLAVLQAEGSELVGDGVDEAAADAAEDVSERSEMQALTASQKLQRVPDLIESGEFEKALAMLEAYRDRARASVVELTDLPLEERGVLVGELLAKKLDDLQLLRVIASMDELLNVDAQITEELMMMVLSLRERELEHLVYFVDSNRYEPAVQKALYTDLKDSVDLNEALVEQLEQLENAVQEEGAVVELEEVALPSDPRLGGDAKTNQAQEDSDDSEDSSNNPEAHNDL